MVKIKKIVLNESTSENNLLSESQMLKIYGGTSIYDDSGSGDSGFGDSGLDDSGLDDSGPSGIRIFISKSCKSNRYADCKKICAY